MPDKIITIFSVKPRKVGDVITLIKKATAQEIIPATVVSKCEDDPRWGHNARDYYKVAIKISPWGHMANE